MAIKFILANCVCFLNFNACLQTSQSQFSRPLNVFLSNWWTDRSRATDRPTLPRTISKYEWKPSNAMKYSDVLNLSLISFVFSGETNKN